MSLIQELKRRNVFRVGIAYVLMGWVLLQGADFVLDLVGAPDWVIRALAVAVVVGLPIAAVFAWAFELTPEGIKRDAEVERDASIAPQTGHRLDRLIIVVLCGVVAWFLFDELYLEPREQGATSTQESAERGTGTFANAGSEGGLVTKSIAVLPFADLSQNRDQAWFAEGLAEEILNALARAPDLLVASRTASFAFRDSEDSIAEIGQALGVDHMLEGSVRRAGDRIRVTAQLIRVEDGFHLWSQNYDRDMSDVISIQEDLAVAIARALETTMDPDALQAMLRAGTRSVEAYEHYLNGLSLEVKAEHGENFDAREAAYAEFEAARTLDPGFSEAHARAAQYWYRRVSISMRGVNADLAQAEKMSRFRERIQEAIRTARSPLQQEKAEAILATAEGRLRDVVRLAGAVFEQRPLDEDNFSTLSDAAVLLADRELLNRLVDHAWTLNEQNIEWAQDYLYYEWRITGQARNHAEFVDNVVALTRRYPQAGLLYQAHRTLLWIGETERAAELLRLIDVDTSPSMSLLKARQACAEGRRGDAEAVLEAHKRRAGEISPADFASVRWHLEMMLGNPQQAADALRPFESTDAPMAVSNFMLYPQFDPTPFPVVMATIQRENIDRPAPILPGFQCPPREDDRQTVAVLPFRAMSSGADDGYFADGLTEEILNALTQVPDLSVTSRTSSFFFKDRDLPISDIAEQLGVRHVVEGSVRRSGDRLRVTAQLIRAEDDTHLWSETFDSTSNDAIAVQEEIATGIAEALGVFLDDRTLGLMRSAGLRDVTAFIEYQKGRELHERAHGHEIDMALLAEGNANYEAALAIQPNFAPAWLFYSDYYTHLLLDHATQEEDVQLSAEEVAEAYEAGRNAFQRAARGAGNAEKRAAIELDLAIYEGKGEAWRPLLEQVLESETCDDIVWHQLVAFVPEYALRFAKATQRLRACDPMTRRYTGMILSAYVWGGAPGEGLAIPEVEDAGLHPFYVKWKIRALIAQGMLDEARATATIDSPNERARQQALVLAAAAAGDADEARRLDAQIRSGKDNHFFALQRAAWLGDRQRANELAAAVDGQALGHLSLMMTTYWCACGAPFDLEMAPNFARIWADADLPWPLESPIDFPLKDW